MLLADVTFLNPPERLLLCLHGCCLDGEAGLVVLDVGIEAGYVFGSGDYLLTGVAAEYYLFEVIFE